MTEDRAKAALEAREQLQAALLACAGMLTQVASATAELAAVAIDREQEASAQYIIGLEKKLSQQQALS